MATTTAPAEPPLQQSGVLPLAEIRPCAFNVRRHFDPADLAGLAESIDRIGLKEPLLVRPIDAKGQQVPLSAKEWRKKTAHFELADGERRWRALTLLAESKDVPPIPVIVRNLTDEEVRAIMLASREQSRELSVGDLVAGYAELRAKLPDDAALAAMVGRPVSHVRGVLRLGKLPGWALAAVDAGALPRATADLVARVPGEEGKARCAALVLHGFPHAEGVDVDDLVRAAPSLKNPDPLSYRETKDLIRHEFQVELKGAPFSRKELYAWPGCEPGHERAMPDCQACPSRAANDEEAKAEGTRGDVCLDVGCYRAKVEAHDERERAKFRKKCKLPDDADVNPDGAALDRDEKPAKGWLDWNGPVQQSELNADGFFAGKKFDGVKVSEVVLECPIVHGCGLRLVLDSKHRPRHLVKTAEARKTLQEAGVLKKPEKATPAVRKSGLPEWEKEKPESGKAAGPSAYEIANRAAEKGARVLGEFAEMNADDLDSIEELTGTDRHCSALFESLEIVARFLVRDHCQFGHERKRFVEAALPDVPPRGDYEQAVKNLTNRQLVGLCVRLAAGPVLDSEAGADGDGFGKTLLDWAELDWPQLQDQARRELAGGETAEQKLEKAEAGSEAAASPEAPDPAPLAAGAPLAGIPDFPAAALEQLARHGIATLEQLDATVAEIAKQPGRGNANRYDAMRALNVPGEAVLDAGDAITDHEPSQLKAAQEAGPQPKARKKGKAK